MAKSTATSTQEHLPIAGIQDGVVIMGDGSVRAVIKVEPINFELKSEQEQNGIIYSYQAFLNSLEYPIQIVIQSKKLDLERYLVKMEGAAKQMTNELLKIQSEDYIDFVRRLISVANIMSKRFYVVVSYAAVDKPRGVSGLFSFVHRAPKGPLLDQDQFQRYQTEVNNRANAVGSGLGRLGMRVSLMTTQQLIELFYGTYNPDIATEERLGETSALTPGLISAQESVAPIEQTPTQPAQPPAPETPIVAQPPTQPPTIAS